MTELERCDRQIEAMREWSTMEPYQHPAYLFVLGFNDLVMERELIEAEQGR